MTSALSSSAATADQGLLRYQRERGEDANLDCGFGLRAGKGSPPSPGACGGQPPDVFEDDGRAYVVMEYVEGDTLSARLKADPLPGTPVTLQILREMAEALDRFYRF